MTKQMDEKLYSEQEAADFYNWSIFTMRLIRKRGEIEYLVFQDKTIRYTLEQLQKYKNEHLVGGSENGNK